MVILSKPIVAASRKREGRANSQPRHESRRPNHIARSDDLWSRLFPAAKLLRLSLIATPSEVTASVVRCDGQSASHPASLLWRTPGARHVDDPMPRCAPSDAG